MKKRIGIMLLSGIFCFASFAPAVKVLADDGDTGQTTRTCGGIDQPPCPEPTPLGRSANPSSDSKDANTATDDLLNFLYYVVLFGTKM